MLKNLDLFNTLQFCTKSVQFLRLNRISTIEEVPLFHVPEVAGRDAFDVGIGGTQVETKLLHNASPHFCSAFFSTRSRPSCQLNSSAP